MISSPKLNEKGQAFEAYRVLIAMVISLAILVIILSAVSYFDELRKKVSTDTVYSSWKSAVDSPNGKVVEARNLYFTKDMLLAVGDRYEADIARRRADDAPYR